MENTVTTSTEKLIVCDRCKLTKDTTPAYGFIPLPDKLNEKRDQQGDKHRIHVCLKHFQQAVENCFYVLKLGQFDDSHSSVFDKNIRAKHRRVRGNDRLDVYVKL